MKSPRFSLRAVAQSPCALRSTLTLALALGLMSGCAAPAKLQPTEMGLQTLNAGDVIKISFPGAPSLDATQQIRRDGRINLAVVGEVKAADRTPGELEKDLLERYASQLTSKEIKVTVVSSSFAVFISGAVLKPGKISPDRAVTALEAVMEAGGFDMSKANTRRVRVIRHEGGEIKNFTLNLKPALDGKPIDPFYLKASDIVFVPEKFTWF